MPTCRQRRGAFAEDVAVAWLIGNDWRVVARNVKVGRHDEIDIVALDPRSAGEIVCVEVRSARSAAFGSPEERVDQSKVAHVYRAARAFTGSDEAAALGVAGLAVRVDLLVVDLRQRQPKIRHLAHLEPP